MTAEAKANIEKLMVSIESELQTVRSLEDPDLPNLNLYKIKKSLEKQKKDLLDLREAYK